MEVSIVHVLTCASAECVSCEFLALVAQLLGSAAV